MKIERALATSDYQCGERTAELIWLAEQASKRKMIVEIGSWKGTTSIAMADNTTGLVYCVDTFKGSVNEEKHQRLNEQPEGWLRETFKRNVAGLSNILICEMESLLAARLFSESGERFDMVFLDASHDYESVKADILAWVPLLRSGGLLCGHDRQWDGVAKAIAELIPNHQVGTGAIWYRP